MSKAKLTLVGVNNVDAEEVRKSLASLYQKPESHFDPHCEHLFDLKQPFVLLRKVEADVAVQHRLKLDEIGIQCEITQISVNDADVGGRNLNIDGSTEIATDSNSIEFADDPELMLLFDNAKKIKENSKKLSNLIDQ